MYIGDSPKNKMAMMKQKDKTDGMDVTEVSYSLLVNGNNLSYDVKGAST